jgi:hypothetical protein
MLISPRLSVRQNPAPVLYFYHMQSKGEPYRVDLDRSLREHAERMRIKSIGPAELKSAGSLLHRWVVLDALYSLIHAGTHGGKRYTGKSMEATVVAWLLDPSPLNLEAVKKWARDHAYFGPAHEDAVNAIIHPQQALAYAARAASQLAENPDWVESDTDEYGNEMSEVAQQYAYDSALVPYKQALVKRAEERYRLLTAMANAHVLPELNAKDISEILR